MEGVSNLKRQLSVDLSLCIFCQTFKVTVDVFDASQQGLETVKQEYSIRRKLNDSKNIDVIDRLDNFFASNQASNLLWHRSCFAIFTNKNKIERLRTKQTPIPQQDGTCSATSSIPMVPRLRIDVKPVDWNLCIFCQSLETNAHLRGVMTKI